MLTTRNYKLTLSGLLLLLFAFASTAFAKTRHIAGGINLHHLTIGHLVWIVSVVGFILLMLKAVVLPGLGFGRKRQKILPYRVITPSIASKYSAVTAKATSVNRGPSPSAPQYVESSPVYYNCDQSQLDEMIYLIEDNNRFRSKQRTIDDWINIIFKGNFSGRCAEILIDILKRENYELNSKLAKDLNDARLKPPITRISVSHIRNYCFCPRSFELVLNHAVNQNYDTLGIGTSYHDSFSAGAGEKVKGTNETTAAIRASVNGVKKVIYTSQSDNEQKYYSKELNLAGSPDGLIEYASGKYSVLEIKTNTSTRTTNPFLGDILQTVAYHYLLKGQVDLISQAILLYYYKQYNERQAFIINPNDFHRQFKDVLSEMKNILEKKATSEMTDNENKCCSCGFRQTCFE